MMGKLYPEKLDFSGIITALNSDIKQLFMAKNKAQTSNKQATGEWPSITQDKTQDSDYQSNNEVKKIPGFRSNERNFDLLVDGVPYTIKSLPFLFNDELRFRIIINGTSEHVFTWDSEIAMIRAINDDSSVLPAGLEEALSEKLQSQLK